MNRIRYKDYSEWQNSKKSRKEMKQQEEFKQLVVEKGKPIKGLIIKVGVKAGSASGDDAGKQGTSSGRLRTRSAR